MWEYVAQVGMQFASNMLAGDSQTNAVAAKRLAALQQNAAEWQDNAAENKAIAETNLQNQIRTGYRVGMLNVQRGQAAKAAAQSGINLSQNKVKALGAANANAAAAGSIGSSVDAVVLDIERQAEQADAGLVEDQRITNSNFDTGMHDILTAGEDALRSPTRARIRDPAMGEDAPSTGDALFGALVSSAGQYAQQYMNLGLGKKTT